MQWRHLCLVRAWSAAGLLSAAILGAGAVAARAGEEPAEPTPGAQSSGQTVGILDAQKRGDLTLSLRGQGADRVKIAVRNNSAQRLRVILPPGLVAASVTGQLQSMGLGTATNNAGSFGRFSSVAPRAGLRSVPPADDRADEAIAVSPGQSVEFSVPAVCLNFGLPTPTPRDVFELKDVDDYSADPRVRKALRTLGTVGTSHGVAQAVMWKVCNDVPFPMMLNRFARTLNVHEAALASRFVQALDAGASDSGELLEPSYFTEGRLFVRVQAEGALAADAERLNGELNNLHVLGLPVRVVDGAESPVASGPALYLNVALSAGRPGETKGRVTVRHTAAAGSWLPLGQATFAEGSSGTDLKGADLARALDHAVSSAFVSVKPVRHATGSTTLKVENRLPFTLGSVVVKAGNSAGAPAVDLPGLGIGPAKSGLAPIQAGSATVDRVVLNGL